MNRIVAFKVMLILGPGLAGCAGMGTGQHPQSAEEILATYSGNGIFQNNEQVVVDRPVGSVVAHVREYGRKCLDIKVNKKRAGRYATDKYGTGTRGDAIPYNAKVASLKNGGQALSV